VISRREDFEPELPRPDGEEIERTVLDTKLAAEAAGWEAKRNIDPGLPRDVAAMPDYL